MIARFVFLLADAGIPGTEGLTPSGQGSTHMQPALVAVAVLAVAIVAFLGADFYRQKRGERKEREKLTRFRQRRLDEIARNAAPQRSD